MKKLFVLIFTLTLSTNAFSWTTMKCDKFLDFRKESSSSQIGWVLKSRVRDSWTWFVIGYSQLLPPLEIKPNKSIVDDLFGDNEPPVTYNQMLYLIENKCRDNPTEMVLIVAWDIYGKIVNDWVKENKRQ